MKSFLTFLAFALGAVAGFLAKLLAGSLRRPPAPPSISDEEQEIRKRAHEEALAKKQAIREHSTSIPNDELVDELDRLAKERRDGRRGR